MADQQDIDQGKQKKRPSRFSIVCLTIMMGFCAVFWGVLYVCALVHAALSPIGQVVGAAWIILWAYMVATTPRNMKRRPSKRQRILAFCGVLMAVGLLIAWIYWPDSGSWKPHTFDEELAAIEAGRAVPNEENAALLYEALFEHVVPRDNVPDIVRSEGSRFVTKPWMTAEHPEVSKWLDEYDWLIAGLIEACQTDSCRFPVESWIFASTEPTGKTRRDKYRFCFIVLLADANRDIGEGRVESGLEKYVCALLMGEHCLQQPDALDFYGGFERKNSALSAISRFIVENERTAGQELDVLAKAIETENSWTSDWLDILAVVKLQEKNFYGKLYEVNEDGRVRFTRNLFTAFSKDDDPGYSQDEPGRFRQGMGRIALAHIAPWSPQTGGTIIDDIYQPFARAADPNFDWDTLGEIDKRRSSEKRRLYSARLLLWFVFTEASDVSRFHASYMRDVARCRGSQLIIGLRRHKNEHGAWPENLEQIKSLVPPEALVDPINGESFVYRRTEEGFTLYSTGPNRIDEEGKRVYIRPMEEGGPDDFAIWPIPQRCNDEN